MDDLDTEAVREIERLQELHRRNVRDIRKHWNEAMLDPQAAVLAVESLLKTIEGRSTSAVLNGRRSYL
jgi:hypothetical protein